MVISLVGIFFQPMQGIDENFPGQVGRRAVKFLIKVISPASNRLTEGQGRRGNIGPFNKVQFVFTGKEKERHRAADDCAGNPQPAPPQVDQIEGMGQVVVSINPLCN